MTREISWTWQCPLCPAAKRKSFDSWERAHESIINHTRGDGEHHNRQWCRNFYEQLMDDEEDMNGKYIWAEEWYTPPPPKKTRYELPIVFVGNIDYELASLTTMRPFLQRHGEVRSIKIMGVFANHRVYAFVMFEDYEDAVRCANRLNGQSFGSRKLVSHVAVNEG